MMWGAILEYEIGLGFAAGFASFLAVAAILGLTHQVEQKTPDRTMPFGLFLGLIVLIMFMAFVEEGIFRWLLVGVASRWVGFLPALTGSSILFTIAHRPNGALSFRAILNLMLVGVILGVVFWWWGFWVAVAAHAGWNLAEWGLGYTVSGEKTRNVLPSPAIRIIAGEPFGPEAHWAATVVLFLVALALHFRV